MTNKINGDVYFTGPSGVYLEPKELKLIILEHRESCYCGVTKKYLWNRYDALTVETLENQKILTADRATLQCLDGNNYLVYIGEL